MNGTVGILGDPFVSRTANVNGTTVHYVRGGSGPAVILLHGFPQDWSVFRRIMPRLARAFTVLALDLRGIGGSTPTPHRFDAAALAEDVHELARHLGLEKPYIAGHDNGGMVAYALARLHPEASRGAMILDVPIPGLEPWEQVKVDPVLWHFGFHQTANAPERLIAGREAVYFREVFFNRLARNREAISDEDLAHYVRSYTLPEQLRAALEFYRAYPENERFNAAQSDRIGLPIVVAGGDDSMAPLNPIIARALRDYGWRNVSVEIIVNSGHQVVDEQPKAVADLLRDTRHGSPIRVMNNESPIPNNADAPKATRREWVGLAVLALPCLLYSMDLTVLNLAVPHLSADLQPSGAQLLWIVDIYGFVVGGSLITMGTLGDRIGRRRLLLIGAVAFGAASALAAFSFTAPMLIAARAVLGVASATLAPSTLSLIRNMFLNPRERTFAVGVWIASFSAGGALGPLLGGLLLEHFWWGSVFLVNVPVMLLLLAVGPRLLPEYRAPNPGRLDPISAALSLLAVLAVIYGIKRIAEGGHVWLSVAVMIVGVVIGVVFVQRQKAIADPLIDLSLFKSVAFSASLAINIVGFFVAFGTFLFIAQYLQLVLGMSPLRAGLWTAPSGLGFIAGSMLAPVLARRMPPTRVIACGFGVAAAGFVVLTQIGRTQGPSVVVIAYVILSLGLSPVFTMTADLIVGTVPPERAGMAAALSETSTEFGGALGIAILGSLVTTVYRSMMASMVPADVPSTAAETARDTLGAAEAVAASLSERTGAALLEAARAAFTEAVVLTAMVSAALAIAAAIVTATMLRAAGSQSSSA